MRVQRSVVISFFQRVANFVFGLRAEFDVDQVHGAGAQAPADIVARDDEIGAGLVDATHREMDMGIIGVPVIDGDPVKARCRDRLPSAEQGRE